MLFVRPARFLAASRGRSCFRSVAFPLKSSGTGQNSLMLAFGVLVGVLVWVNAFNAIIGKI